MYGLPDASSLLALVSPPPAADRSRAAEDPTGVLHRVNGLLMVAAAARRDIALTPSTTFCITPGHAPNAVRLALAAPAIEQLDFALRTLADILRTQQDDFDSTE